MTGFEVVLFLAALGLVVVAIVGAASENSSTDTVEQAGKEAREAIDRAGEEYKRRSS